MTEALVVRCVKCGTEVPAVGRFCSEYGPTSIAIFGIAAFAVVRFGLIALAAGLFTVDLIITAPMAASFSSWYATATAFVFLSVLTLAAWGFYTSLGGQRLWSDKMFD